MTRCLYAQLAQQQFTPDKRSGWTVVSPSNPEFLERDIGVKLVKKMCFFFLLYLHSGFCLVLQKKIQYNI